MHHVLCCADWGALLLYHGWCILLCHHHAGFVCAVYFTVRYVVLFILCKLDCMVSFDTTIIEGCDCPAHTCACTACTAAGATQAGASVAMNPRTGPRLLQPSIAKRRFHTNPSGLHMGIRVSYDHTEPESASHNPGIPWACVSIAGCPRSSYTNQGI